DIANRREVTRLEDKVIERAVLSPNGQQVALVTRSQVQGGGPLWVVNLDGTDLRPLVSDVIARQLLWSPNSHLIFYDLEGDEWTGIERVDVASGERQRILTVESPTFLHILGWSAGGQWLYYICPASEGDELWKLRHDGSSSQLIISLGTGYTAGPLSPSGSKILLYAREDLGWISTDGRERGDIRLPQPTEIYQAVWGKGENEVIVGQVRESLYHVYAINIQSQQVQELATFDIPAGPGWDQLSLSSDHHWLMSHIYQAGHYWIHLPTGTIIPVSCQEYGVQFIAWIPKGAGQ
ncbi:MAG: hypothetical protein HXY24_16480, partial [Rubrivivax sp.]|nr:hypothetical protein [Rubrivivax sp.]